MGTVHRKLPFEPKVALGPRVGVAGNQGNEQGTTLDLPPDGIVPGITPAQFAAIEPHFDARRPQGGANALGRGCILRGIAQKYGARGTLGGCIGGMCIDVVQWLVRPAVLFSNGTKNGLGCAAVQSNTPHPWQGFDDAQPKPDCAASSRRCTDVVAFPRKRYSNSGYILYQYDL